MCSRFVLAMVLIAVLPAMASAVDCDVHRYREYCESYPGSEAWRSIDPYPSQALDAGWPICVSEDGATVESLFPSGACDPDGPTPIEIGRCEPAAYYYEKVGAFRAKPHTHYAFLFNADHCEPCAYEARSAVATCRSICDEVFGKLGFDGTDFVEMASSDPRSLRSLVLPSGRYEGQTAYETCVDNCGPAPSGAPLVESSPKGIDEARGNHWFHTVYGRDWNPNKKLDNWIRSYAVNPDKRTAPANVCRRSIFAYCEEVSSDDTEEAACLSAGLDFGIASSAGLCEAWLQASYLCDGTCYAFGRDARLIPEHVCLGRGAYCDGERAVCEQRR